MAATNLRGWGLTRACSETQNLPPLRSPQPSTIDPQPCWSYEEESCSLSSSICRARILFHEGFHKTVCRSISDRRITHQQQLQKISPIECPRSSLTICSTCLQNLVPLFLSLRSEVVWGTTLRCPFHHRFPCVLWVWNGFLSSPWQFHSVYESFTYRFAYFELKRTIDDWM